MVIILNCGHSPNSADQNGNPSCAICKDILDIIPSAKVDLKNRKARCVYYSHSSYNSGSLCFKGSCFCERVSDTNLAFFEFTGNKSHLALNICKCGFSKNAHSPLYQERNSNICRSFIPKGPREFDLFYCGCYGWD